MLSTTGTSPRCGSTTVPRKAEIANRIAVPITDRIPAVHSGGKSCRIALMIGQLVPHATAMAARSATASRRRSRWDCMRPAAHLWAAAAGADAGGGVGRLTACGCCVMRPSLLRRLLPPRGRQGNRFVEALAAVWGERSPIHDGQRQLRGGGDILATPTVAEQRGAWRRFGFEPAGRG